MWVASGRQSAFTLRSSMFSRCLSLFRTAEMLIGIGREEQIDRLIVRWPTGEEQVFKDSPANARISITEGTDQFSVTQ